MIMATARLYVMKLIGRLQAALRGFPLILRSNEILRAYRRLMLGNLMYYPETNSRILSMSTFLSNRQK